MEDTAPTESRKRTSEEPPELPDAYMARSRRDVAPLRCGGLSRESRQLVSGPALAPWDMQDSAVDAMEAALGISS
jgi:hypothetical protein